MASIGKINYYSTLAPATDSGFAYPIVQAPADKAIKLTSLSFYNNSNTTNCSIFFSILPAKTSSLADGSYEIAQSVAFPCGFLGSPTIGTSILVATTVIGNIRITAHESFLIPAGALLVAYPDPSANLNGTLQYSAIGYECEVGY